MAENKKPIDVENERKWLQGVASNGGEHAEWAQRKAQEFGISLSQPNTPPVESAPNTGNPQGNQGYDGEPSAPQFDAEGQMAQMGGFLQDQSTAFLDQQKASLDMMMEQQLSQIKMTYNQAVADGKMSVREAEEQFQAQSEEINKQAYLDAERTGLYSQGMGIQNSQQMVGLMQGDNARKNSMINANMSERDSRINNVKDRLKQIKQNKSLDMARVNAEYNSGLLNAQGQANQMYSQGMLGLMQDNYNRQADYANQVDMFGRNVAHDENMQQGQFAQQERMADINHDYRLSELGEQSKLRMDEMFAQHGYNKEMFEAEAKHAFEVMAEEYRQRGLLSDKDARNAMARMKEQVKLENKAIAQREQAELNELKKSYLDPNSDQYKIREAQIKEASKMQAQEIGNKLLTEFDIQSKFNDPALELNPQMPKNYTEGMPLGEYDPVGNVLNWATNRDEKMEQYNRDYSNKTQAEQALERMMERYGY